MLKTFGLAALTAFLLIPNEAGAAYNGEKIKTLTSKLKDFAADGCNADDAAEVGKAMAAINGSLGEIKDERIRAAHVSKLREATADSRDSLMQATLGEAPSSCAGQVAKTIKKVNALPVLGSSGAEEAAPAPETDLSEK